MNERCLSVRWFEIKQGKYLFLSQPLSLYYSKEIFLKSNPHNGNRSVFRKHLKEWQILWLELHLYFYTENLEFFARILFSRIALKDIFATLKIGD